MVAVPIPLGFLDGSLGPAEDHGGGEAELAENLVVLDPNTLSDDPGEGNSPARRDLPGHKAKCSRRPTEAAIAAAADGDSERLRAALQDGWPPDKTCAGATALHWAAGSGHQDCCAVLLDEFRASIDYSGRSGRTALHWAARNSQTDLCQWLVNKGANPKLVTHDGVNLFHWAVFGRCIETCRWSIAAGADPYGLNRWGCSAIHWAASTGDVALCTWLRDEVGLDFKQRNNQGHDGLMKAAWNGGAELCEVLLSWDPETIIGQDRAGMGPPEMAQVNGHADLAAALQNYQRQYLGKVPTSSGSEADAYQVLAKSEPSDICRPLSNKAFVIFYRNQGLVAPDKWDALHDALLRPLPVTIRLRSSSFSCRGQGEAMLDRLLSRLLTKQFPELKPLHFDGKSRSHGDDCTDTSDEPAAVFQVCNTAWKRSRALQELCERAARAGLLDTQLCIEDILAAEILHLEPQHSVLDMCSGDCGRALCCLDALVAASGALVPEMGEANGNNITGVVVANGENAKHFVEASSILRRGSIPMLATVGNPVRYPCLFSQDGDQELYDRVVCMPPCSGDGLLRSKAHLWREWKMSSAFPLHIRQVKLLLRGLHLLSPGGQLLFCTQSLNPLEGEAVVLAALRRYKGAVRLLDLAARLPPWVTPADVFQSWKVPDPEGVSLFRFYTCWDDVPSVLRPPHGPLRETMFTDSDISAELSKCVRLLPGTQEAEKAEGAAACGGCFMALFGKDSHRAANAADWTTTKPKATSSQVARPPKFARQFRRVDSLELETLEQFYGLKFTDDLLQQVGGTLAVDCDSSGSQRYMCLMSQATSNAAICHASSLTASQVHCLGAGLPLFSRMDARFLKMVTCRWRPCVEAASWLAKHASRRVVRLERSALIAFLDLRIILLDTCLGNHTEGAQNELEHGDPSNSSEASREQDDQDERRMIADAVLSEPSCCSALNSSSQAMYQTSCRRIHPGGLLMGHVESGIWVPALLTNKEIKLAADKDRASVLKSLVVAS